jgi:hypothetical protein
MAKFKIYGDSTVLLEEFDTRSEALRWADRYVGRGDFGGYDSIRVRSVEADGSAVTVMTYYAEDYEFYEGDDDFALIDEF